MTSVAPVSEERLAWELVDRHRDCLPDDQRHSVFVNLGIGEYAPAIHCVLTALVGHGRVLSATSVAQLQAWMASYDIAGEFGPLLERASGELS